MNLCYCCWMYNILLPLSVERQRFSHCIYRLSGPWPIQIEYACIEGATETTTTTIPITTFNDEMCRKISESDGIAVISIQRPTKSNNANSRCFYIFLKLFNFTSAHFISLFLSIVNLRIVRINVHIVHYTTRLLHIINAEPTTIFNSFKARISNK